MTVFDQFGVKRPNPVVTSKFENAARRTVTLLVEAGFDQRFWQMHADASCRVQHQGQGGRAAALAYLEEARHHDDAVLIAVLDADLDRVEGRLRYHESIVWTDAHDLETTLGCLPALEKLVLQRVAAQDLAAHELRWGEGLRERLFRHALGMGKLRWHVARVGARELKFKKEGKGSQRGQILYFSDYSNCVELGWAPSVQRVLAATVSYNNAQRLQGQLHDWLAKMDALPNGPVEQICNGHDLLGFLHVWLKEASSVPPSLDSLPDLLALACERSWLAGTGMWRAIRAWEAAHPGFQVLASDHE